jgi:ABC-2 type transport system permease protein
VEVEVGKTMLALLHRDMRVVRRELVYTLLRVGLQPILFTFIFGYVMPRLGLVTASYTTMLLPGILSLSMTLSSMQAVALPLVIDFGWTKEIEDRLLAPISITGVAVEKILVGIIQAIIAGAVVFPLAWLMMGTRLSFTAQQLFLLAGVSVLSGWLFAAFGMVVGTAVAPQQIALVFNLLLAPMIFFGCAYYPWAALTKLPWFQKLVLVNPLVYASEGFRAAITPEIPHMPAWLILAGLFAFSVGFTYFGLLKFKGRALD